MDPTADNPDSSAGRRTMLARWLVDAERRLDVAVYAATMATDYAPLVRALAATVAQRGDAGTAHQRALRRTGT